MTREQLNAIFTQKAEQYISKGYTFCTNTMGGSQGEIAKIDLIKGTHFIRIVMDNNYGPTQPFISIRVLEQTNFSSNIDSSSHTVWTNRLSIVDEYKYYMFLHYDTYYYMNEQEFDSRNIEQSRRERAYKYELRPLEFDLKDKKIQKIVLSFMRRQPKCKSIRIDDITSLSKQNGVYKIVAKKKTYILK